MRVLGIVLGIIVALGAALFVFVKFIAPEHVLDGPGMVYDWKTQELYGDWVEIDPNGEPTSLRVDADTVSTKFMSLSGSTGYEIEETNSQQLELKLKYSEDVFWESLVFQRVTIDDQPVQILSGTAFEFDGRGTIVMNEFVRADKAHLVPEGYRSPYCISRNDSPAPSMSRYPFDMDSAYYMRRSRLIPGEDVFYEFEPEGIVEVFVYPEYPDPNSTLTGISQKGADVYFAGLQPGEVKVTVKNTLVYAQSSQRISFTLQVDDDLQVTRVEG